MKKKDFITLLLIVVGGLLFSLGMCMALVPDMVTLTGGVLGAAVTMLPRILTLCGLSAFAAVDYTNFLNGIPVLTGV